MKGSISLRSVRKTYGKKIVLDGVSLEVGPGQIHGLFGANGSGKSTLLRIIANLIKPCSGEVRLCGSMGYVAQKFGLYDDLTVEENLRFYASCQDLHGAAREQAVGRITDLLQLTPLRRDVARELSHGWRQRVSLAAAICHAPSVLVLDEVTAGIDADGRRDLWRIFHDFANDGGAILIATHHAEEAALCSTTGALA